MVSVIHPLNNYKDNQNSQITQRKKPSTTIKKSKELWKDMVWDSLDDGRPYFWVHTSQNQVVRYEITSKPSTRLRSQCIPPHCLRIAKQKCHVSYKKKKVNQSSVSILVSIAMLDKDKKIVSQITTETHLISVLYFLVIT